MTNFEKADNSVVGLAHMPPYTPSQGMGVVSDKEPVVALLQTIATERQLDAPMRQYMRQHPEEAFQSFIDRFGLVYAVKIGGEISVYSMHQKNRLPSPVLKRLESLLHVWPDTPVGWYRSVESDPVPTTAGVVFYGKSARQVRAEKPVGLKSRDKAELRRKLWAKNTDLATAADIVDKLLA